MADIISDGARGTNVAFGVEHQRLFYLHDLDDYQVHHDDTDVRGWKVALDDAQVIGTVDNLVVDKDAERVRYLEVKTDRTFTSKYRDGSTYLDRDDPGVKGDADELLMIPIGIAEIDHSRGMVRLRGFSADYFGKAPRYRRGSKMRPRYEVESLHYYDNNYEHRDDKETAFSRDRYRDFDHDRHQGLGDDFYQHRMFDRSSFYDRHDEAIRSKGL